MYVKRVRRRFYLRKWGIVVKGLGCERSGLLRELRPMTLSYKNVEVIDFLIFCHVVMTIL